MIPDNCPRKNGKGACSEIPMYHKDCCDKEGNLSCLSIRSCQYKGCMNIAQIGFYCWEHNPYTGMWCPIEEEKRRKHYEDKI